MQKWGNSLAVRIPSAFANEISIGEGQQVDIRVTRGRLVIAPIRGKSYDLTKLVAGITRGNRHTEIEIASAQGREVW